MCVRQRGMEWIGNGMEEANPMCSRIVSNCLVFVCVSIFALHGAGVLSLSLSGRRMGYDITGKGREGMGH